MGGKTRKHLIWTFFRHDPSVLCQNESSERGERRETASARSALGLRHFNDPGIQMRGSSDPQTGAEL